MGSTHVHVRLNNAAWARFSKEAEVRAVPLGTYLRQRLEQQDELLANEIAALRAVVEHAGSAGQHTRYDGPALASGALVEALLLLRSLVGPQKAALVQKELERRGLDVWR